MMIRLTVCSALVSLAAVLSGCRTCAVPDDLAYYSTFDDVAAIENPVVGPTGTVVNARFVEGKVGRGFEIEGRSPGARVALPPNFFGPEGTIEFWAKIENPKDYFVDGGDPRFFQVGDGVNFPIFFLEFAANDGGGNSGLHVLAVDNWKSSFSGFHGSMPYSRVLGDAQKEWHHYAIVWNRDAEEKLAVYLDGKVQFTSKKFYTDAKMEELFGAPLLLTFGLTREKHINLSKCTYVIDEFKIWRRAKDFRGMKREARPAAEDAPDAQPTANGRRATIYLSDGSVLKGAVRQKSLDLDSVIGPLEIPLDKVRSLQIGE